MPQKKKKKKKGKRGKEGGEEDGEARRAGLLLRGLFAECDDER
jgi:hypothetical protein